MQALLDALGGPDAVERWLLVGALVAARVAPLTVFAPWLTLRKTPPILRAGIVVALTLALAPLAEQSVALDVAAADALTFGAWLLREALVGTLFAVVTSLPFFALDWAGRLVDTWRGASLAEVIAPPTGERTSPLGDLYLLMGIALFLALGGHRLAFRAFAEGLAIAPVGGARFGDAGAAIALGAAELSGAALAFAMAIAAPAAAAIVVVEVALGLVARAAPQVPVFFAGMPLRAATGIAAMLLSLTVVTGEIRGELQAAIDASLHWLSRLSP